MLFVFKYFGPTPSNFAHSGRVHLHYVVCFATDIFICGPQTVWWCFWVIICTNHIFENINASNLLNCTIFYCWLAKSLTISAAISAKTDKATKSLCVDIEMGRSKGEAESFIYKFICKYLILFIIYDNDAL